MSAVPEAIVVSPARRAVRAATRAGADIATAQPLGLAAAASLLAGVCACMALPGLPPWPLACAGFAIGLAAWLQPGRRRWIGAMLLGFGWAALHGTLALHRQLPAALEGSDFALHGTVVGLPAVEPRRTRFLLRVDADHPRAELRGRLLRLTWYDPWRADGPGPRLRLHAGERWSLRAELRAPRGLRNPGGSDAERYAVAERIGGNGMVRDAEAATRIGSARGIDAWRGRMSARIAGALADAGSARFVRALALGDTSPLADDDWGILRATGLTHLIAISGFHVGLVAGFFALLARAAWWCAPALSHRLPRQFACGLAATAGAVLYAALAGFALPTLRTVLMIAVAVAARSLRRPAGAWQALALALLALLLADPLSVLAPGFWLSFVGVAWLLWCMPQGRTPLLREFAGAQGVATVGLMPLVASMFGQVSLLGPVANLVAVPWWSLVVVPLSLLGTGLEAAIPGAGTWPWRAAAWCFDASWMLFSRMAALPGGLVWLAEAPWWAFVLAVLGAFWLLLPRGVPGKSLALLLWLPLLWPAQPRLPPGEAELQVLDVGQGLALLVRTREHVLAYDMGPASRDGYDAGRQVVVPALRALGVRRLDASVVSHGDNDHAGGFASVRAAFPHALAWSPAGGPVPGTTPCIAGDSWTWDGVVFRFLHPARGFPYLKNDASCVLRIETAQGALLFTGDIDAVVERMLLRNAAGRLRSAVVLAAHHGSGGSSDDGFVAATGARLVVFSTGHGNRYRHPQASVVERWHAHGADSADTADTGALGIRLHAGDPEVQPRRATHRRWWDAVARARKQASAARAPASLPGTD